MGDVTNENSEIRTQIIGGTFINARNTSEGEKEEIKDPTKEYSFSKNDFIIYEEMPSLEATYSEWERKRVLTITCLHQEIQDKFIEKLLFEVQQKSEKSLEIKGLEFKDDNEKRDDLNLNFFIRQNDLYQNCIIVVHLIPNSIAARVFIETFFNRKQNIIDTLSDRNIWILCQIESNALNIYENFIVKKSNKAYLFAHNHISFLDYLASILENSLFNRENAIKYANILNEKRLDGNYGQQGTNEIELYDFLIKDIDNITPDKFIEKVNAHNKEVTPIGILKNDKDKLTKKIYLTLFYVSVYFPRLRFREFRELVEFILKLQSSIKVKQIIESSIKSDNTENIIFNEVSEEILLIEIWRENPDKYLRECYLKVYRDSDGDEWEYVSFSLPHLRKDIKVFLIEYYAFIDDCTRAIIFHQFIFHERFSESFKEAIIKLIVDTLSSDDSSLGSYPLIRLIQPFIKKEILLKKTSEYNIEKMLVQDWVIDEEIIHHSMIELLKRDEIKQFFYLLFGLLNNPKTVKHVNYLFNVLIDKHLAPVVLLLLQFKGYPTSFNKVFWIRQIIHRGSIIKDIKDIIHIEDNKALRKRAYAYLNYLPIENVDNIYSTLETIRDEWTKKIPNDKTLKDIELEESSNILDQSRDIHLGIPEFLYDFAYNTLAGLPNRFYGVWPPRYYLFIYFTKGSSEIEACFNFLIKWLFNLSLEGALYSQKLEQNDFKAIWKDISILRFNVEYLPYVYLPNSIKPFNADLIEGWFTVLIGNHTNNKLGTAALEILIRILNENLTKKEIKYLKHIWALKKRFYIDKLADIPKSDREQRKPIEQKKNNLRQLIKLIKNT